MATIDKPPLTIPYARTGRAAPVPVPEDTSPISRTIVTYLLTCVGIVVGALALGALALLLLSTKFK